MQLWSFVILKIANLEHATRPAEKYWRESLKREEADSSFGRFIPSRSEH